ncbi:metal-dependent protein hydrolase [Aspergillus pseudodeflectus]|uniref:Metal-dependent protein hydrolase n=1 Tax=Aspergillus pseudodeflectus TaxID=176178 RepID=A0ABR4KSD1_9EURO
MLRRIFRMAEESVSKKPRIGGPQIGTHNGHFHADEALAVYLLRLLPTYSQSPLIRTRDPALLATCHTVVDVGGEYDAATNRYDHHQRTFSTTFPGYNTKLSSAGLVYMHFGRDIIAQHTKLPADHDNVNLLYKKLYTDFVEAVDANDNGVSVYDSEAVKSAGLEKRFRDGGVTIASIVNDMNNGVMPGEDSLSEDALFENASTFIGSVFHRKLILAAGSWLPARETVKAAYENRKNVHASGRILVIEAGGGVPWKEHLYNFEKEAAAAGAGEDAEVYYVLYPESATEGAKWRIQAVSVNEGSFVSRRPLPESWRGVRDQDLDGVLKAQGAGVPEGAIFVHASGFIGGHKTKEGAFAMALKALE